LGLLATELKAEAVASWPGPLRSVDLEPVGAQLEAMETELREELQRQGAAPDSVSVGRLLDLRYLGQSFELRVAWAGPDAAEIERMFHVLHKKLYGFSVPAEPVELVALRVTALGSVGPPPRLELGAATGPVVSVGNRALITSDPARREKAELIERDTLAAGHQLEGPALVFDADATTYLPPGWLLNVESGANLVLERTA
jgi:N-methylhydantoinase A